MKNDQIKIRQALNSDIPVLERWDREPHVIKATTDAEVASVAFSEDHDWQQELNSQNEYSKYLIAELNGQPIAGLQVIDPHNEETHYWGEIEPHLRAIDIWIGEKEALGKGYGTIIMSQVIDMCFDEASVVAIVIDPLYSNKRAHVFYQRLGFVPIERRLFAEEDDCLVLRLERTEWEKRSQKQ